MTEKEFHALLWKLLEKYRDPESSVPGSFASTEFWELHGKIIKAFSAEYDEGYREGFREGDDYGLTHPLL